MLLKTGDKGIQVTYLQYALHIMCCSPGGIDGTFGAGTEAAVRKYQERHGLSVDGQVGDATWNSLTGEIKIIQRALSQKGYYSQRIRFRFSVKTRFHWRQCTLPPVWSTYHVLQPWWN